AGGRCGPARTKESSCAVPLDTLSDVFGSPRLAAGALRSRTCKSPPCGCWAGSCARRRLLDAQRDLLRALRRDVLLEALRGRVLRPDGVLALLELRELHRELALVGLLERVRLGLLAVGHLDLARGAARDARLDGDRHAGPLGPLDRLLLELGLDGRGVLLDLDLGGRDLAARETGLLRGHAHREALAEVLLGDLVGL